MKRHFVFFVTYQAFNFFELFASFLVCINCFAFQFTRVFFQLLPVVILVLLYTRIFLTSKRSGRIINEMTIRNNHNQSESTITFQTFHVQYWSQALHPSWWPCPTKDLQTRLQKWDTVLSRQTYTGCLVHTKEKGVKYCFNYQSQKKQKTFSVFTLTDEKSMKIRFFKFELSVRVLRCSPLIVKNFHHFFLMLPDNFF